MDRDLPHLTTVVVVCREFAGLNDLAQLISEFEDPSALWYLGTACNLFPPGGLRLLDRIAAREDPQMDPYTKRAEFALRMDTAIRQGNLEVTKWLVERYLPAEIIRRKLASIAVKCNRLNILEWLNTNHHDRIAWDISEVPSARFSRLETIQWVYCNVAPIDQEKKSRMMFEAVRWGRIEIVEWLNTLELPFLQSALSVAVGGGKVEMVKWIRDNTDARFEERLLVVAVRNWRLDTAKWLYENYRFSTVGGSSISRGIRSIVGRAPYDQISLELNWILDHLVISNKEGLASAISTVSMKGDLDAVKKIHELSGDGMCSYMAMDAAATKGHLDVVVWLHENRREGCTTHAMDGAARCGHRDVVRWLHDNRNEGCAMFAMTGAARNGHLGVVIWLHEHRNEAMGQGAMDAAAANGHLEVVIWLHENRSEGCTAMALDDAARGGHLETVKWLCYNRSEGNVNSAIQTATSNGKPEIVEWLRQYVAEDCQSDS